MVMNLHLNDHKLMKNENEADSLMNITLNMTDKAILILE